MAPGWWSEEREVRVGSRRLHPIQYLNVMIGNRVTEYRRNNVTQSKNRGVLH